MAKRRGRLQWIITVGLGHSSECLRRRGGLRGHRSDRSEVIARETAAHVELVSDDWKPHRVRAEQQLAVLDGMEAADINGNIVRATAVPTGAMAAFRGVRGLGRHFAC